eukprot:scaffold24723_cov131-Isochrysis_galbana.AAC.7
MARPRGGFAKPNSGSMNCPDSSGRAQVARGAAVRLSRLGHQRPSTARRRQCRCRQPTFRFFQRNGLAGPLSTRSPGEHSHAVCRSTFAFVRKKKPDQRGICVFFSLLGRQRGRPPSPLRDDGPREQRHAGQTGVPEGACAHA